MGRNPLHDAVSEGGEKADFGTENRLPRQGRTPLRRRFRFEAGKLSFLTGKTQLVTGKRKFQAGNLRPCRFVQKHVRKNAC